MQQEYIQAHASSREHVHQQQPLWVQVLLGPALQVLNKMQYEAKAITSEWDQGGIAASLMAGSSSRLLQMQHKAQAVQRCIDHKLEQVTRASSCDSMGGWGSCCINRYQITFVLCCKRQQYYSRDRGLQKLNLFCLSCTLCMLCVQFEYLCHILQTRVSKGAVSI